MQTTEGRREECNLGRQWGGSNTKESEESVEWGNEAQWRGKDVLLIPKQAQWRVKTDDEVRFLFCCVVLGGHLKKMIYYVFCSVRKTFAYI